MTSDLWRTVGIVAACWLGLLWLGSSNRRARARVYRAARRGVTWIEAKPSPNGWEFERRRHARACGVAGCKTCELIAQTMRELEQLRPRGPRWWRALNRWAVGDPIARAYELEK